MRHTLTPRRYGWCWTISTPTSSDRCTMRLSQPKRGASPSAWNSITLRTRQLAESCPGLPNMAEIELSVFSNQCLNRRISDEAVLKREVSALERERNRAYAVIDWRFSTQDARTKLQHIYPSYSD